jgi:predicted neuraminidase
VVAPASVERGLWRCFMDLSDDEGETWQRTALIEARGTSGLDEGLLFWQKKAEEARREGIPFDRAQVPSEYAHGRGIIQPTLWEDVDGVHALMRATDGWIWRSDSVNGGETWCVCRRTSLENINSGIDCVLASDGRLYLVLNGPSRDRKKKRGYRNHLEVVASGDGGATWKTVATLADDGFFQPNGRKTEFSYPAIIEPRPGVLAISFTWNRRQIRFVEISCKVAAAR